MEKGKVPGTPPGTFLYHLQEGAPQQHDRGLVGLEAHGRRRKHSKAGAYLRYGSGVVKEKRRAQAISRAQNLTVNLSARAALRTFCDVFSFLLRSRSPENVSIDHVLSHPIVYHDGRRARLQQNAQPEGNTAHFLQITEFS